MKKVIAFATAALLFPAAAMAAEPAPQPEKCCCEKMKEQGKDCCADMDKSKHEQHGDHQMDAPKS